jgi:hypothetical protein
MSSVSETAVDSCDQTKQQQSPSQSERIQPEDLQANKGVAAQTGS